MLTFQIFYLKTLLMKLEVNYNLIIKNTNHQGAETFWLIESGARTTLERLGISLDVLKVGSKVTATGRKGRRQYTMYLREIELADGTVFVPQPDLN